MILNWNLETDNIEGDELLGVNVIIMKRDKESKKKIMTTLTFRAGKDEGRVERKQRPQIKGELKRDLKAPRSYKLCTYLRVKTMWNCDSGHRLWIQNNL